MDKRNDFESQLNRLEEIVLKLEEGDFSLSELLEMYEEGMHLVVDCREFLDKAEQKVIEINKKTKSKVTVELDKFTKENLQDEDDASYKDYLPQ